MENKNQQAYVIYILLSPKKKSFLILRGHKNSLREAYRHHLALRRFASKNFVQRIQPERPCLFILEEIDPEERANLLLVWIKILEEQGYLSCNHPDIIEQTEHLYIDNMLAYNKRKATDLSALFTCEKCLAPVYKKISCPHYCFTEEVSNRSLTTSLPRNCQKKENVEIRFSVTEEENEMILTQAKRLGMQRNIYIKYASKYPVIHQHNYKAVYDHTQELGQIRTAINRLIYTIEATNNYLPKEIVTIVNLMQEVFATENELLKELREQRESQEKCHIDIL